MPSARPPRNPSSISAGRSGDVQRVLGLNGLGPRRVSLPPSEKTAGASSGRADTQHENVPDDSSMTIADGRPYRFGHRIDGDWKPYSYPAVFESGRRIVAGVCDYDLTVFEHMVECLQPPFRLLYVLHTPRGEARPGRYQSPELSLAQVKTFVTQFHSLLAGDGRFDLWAYAALDEATVVWDRHNLLYAYGPLARFDSALRRMGFASGVPQIPGPHQHCYWPQLDPVARDLMSTFDWSYSPLRPEDEQ